MRWVGQMYSDGDVDKCDKCADVPLISDMPRSLSGAGKRRCTVFDKYLGDSIYKQGELLDL